MTFSGLRTTGVSGLLFGLAAVFAADLHAPSQVVAAPASTVAVRAGDPAPVPARAPESWGCRLRTAAAGDILYVDRQRTAVVLLRGEEVLIVAHVGDRVPEGTLSEVCEAEIAPDGSVVFRALLATPPGGSPRAGIYRRPPSGGDLETVLASREIIPLRDGDATIGAVSGPAVDGAGRVVVAVDVAAAAAVLRLSPGAAAEILVQTGDPIGGAAYMRSPTAPAAGQDGTVVFTATSSSGIDMVAVLPPGGSPSVIFEGSAPPGEPLPSVSPARPAVNAAGDVAFLWRAGGQIRVQRVSSGVSETVAGPGSPAPDSETFVEITDLPPVLDESGGVLFGALRSGGVGGLYLHRQAPEAVAEQGGSAGGGEVFAPFGLHQPQASPAATPDGTLLFAAADGQGEALFAWAGGVLRTVLRAGQDLPVQARFVSFIEPSFPFLGGGPFLAGAGGMIFDARLTTGVRGLFLLDPGGDLAAAAMAGEPAPGGGHLDGRFLSFHSVNDTGRYAFLGAAPDTAGGTGLVLYYGGGDAGPLRRVVGVGDPLPGSAGAVTGFQPPSRVNNRGEIAVPAFAPEGTVSLLGYDGAALFRIAGPGDALPGGGSIQTVFTGSPTARLPVPPHLDDSGIVTFGAFDGDGRAALYEAPLLAGGIAAARRIIGDGDLVEGGALTPFELQSFDRDAQGQLTLQAVFDSSRLFGTFLEEDGALALLARRFDPIEGFGLVQSVRARLALAGEGRLVHGVLSTSGADLLLLRQPPPPPGTAARGHRLDQEEEPVTSVLAATGQPAPDGGVFLAFQPAGRATARLASDGAGRLAIAAATDAGPQEIVSIDLDPNAPPVGDAGPDQVVECTGPEGATVMLDGRLSTDPDGGLLTYVWTGPFGTATGARPTVILPLGISTVTLVVTDEDSTSSTDTVAIEVRDSRPPGLTVDAIPERLWPPNGDLVPISFVIAVSDLCDPAPRVTLDRVTIEDPKGSDPATDVAGAAFGTDDRQIELRARRSGGSARTYTATYRASDASGNGASGSANVVVPAKQGA